MKKMTIDGNYACSLSAYNFTEVAGIYPITPSSTMAELVDDWSNKNKLNIFNDRVKVVQMQSEAGAAGMVHGSLQTGLLTTTFTASQGLLLMIPNIYKMVGEMLPFTVHVAARSLSTHALSILGDHQDIYAARQTGISMLASSSVQDAHYMSIIAHLTALKSSIPIMHFFDGFRTSHELAKIDVLEKEDYEHLLPTEELKKFREKALHPGKAITRGTAQNDDIYFQATEVRNKFHDIVPDIINHYMNEINKITNTNYQPFNYYGSKSAKKIIIAMGSVNETIKETIDDLGGEIGLIEVHLYRPFSIKYLTSVLPSTVEKIAVLDRTKEAGSIGEPLYQDIVSALQNKNIEIVGGRYGLSSKNTTPSQIKAVYDMLDHPRHNFTIGINDDVTNLSLPLTDYKIKNSKEFVIYGYGSDGMVSASKSIIKIASENSYAQGYFQYDSKKSGGVTVSQLRFSDKPIRSTYYVENPSVVVVTKDSYFMSYEPIKNIENNGILILNTNRSVNEIFPSDVIEIMKNRNIKLYTIDAYNLAASVGLNNKISTVMQVAILKLTNLVENEHAVLKMKELIKEMFLRKGEDVVNANYRVIDSVDEHIKEIDINTIKPIIKIIENSNFEIINRREGDSLSVSAFLENPEGTLEGGSTKFEKRAISEVVPKWESDNCIQCTQCSLVCPHGVIRPFYLNEEEYKEAPEYVQKVMIKPIEKHLQDYYFAISVSPKDCTGCGLCMNICPGRMGKKALIPSEYSESIKTQKQEVADYLFNNIKDKNLSIPNTVKSTQFKEPKFVFSGACAGCGETPYLKLLTQMFGDNMVIANATGCSSIYGASAPSTPYTVPWASSLFEDNAEYGYGMLIASEVAKSRIEKIMLDNMNNANKELFTKWLDGKNSYQITKEVYDSLDYSTVPVELLELKDYIKARSIWTIGGDGWAYDIGFGGIDHILSNNENSNILVLDTQVYSNTGGQSSKASATGSIAPFTGAGKTNVRKNLARIALSYPNTYVAQVSLAANQMQLIKAFNEAEAHDGPSIIIAYSPCIAHGIKGGMVNSLDSEKLAVKSGYFPIFRYDPKTDVFTLDSKTVDFDLYDEFLNSQIRYSMLKAVNPDNALELLKVNKDNAIKTFDYYKKLSEEIK